MSGSLGERLVMVVYLAGQSQLDPFDGEGESDHQSGRDDAIFDHGLTGSPCRTQADGAT